MKELDKIGAVHDLVPLVRVNVDHGPEELDLKISIFTTVLSHDNVLL